mgnify:CR=1 FL=1
MPELPFTETDAEELNAALEALNETEGLLKRSELAGMNLKGQRSRFEQQKAALLKIKAAFNM